MAADCTVRVAVHAPAHSGLAQLLSYSSDQPLAPGGVVRVPLGRRELLGVVWDDAPGGATALPEGVPLRPVAAVLEGLAPLSPNWRRLVEFAARYYQRSIGEVASSALPQLLRTMLPGQLARRLSQAAKPAARASPMSDGGPPEPSGEQARALAHIRADAGPFLLHGSTGSGKTEVYLRAVQDMLEQRPQGQALVLVPEINLTPQLQARFQARFGAQFGAGSVVGLHSAMTQVQRFKSWLAAHSGAARIVLGTRMAIFASLPDLALIVVDEEHDSSYKQQEGARWSARDLAIWRAREVGGKVILGSATPSLESWHASRAPDAADPGSGRYLRLHMPGRIGAAQLPRLRVVDMRQQRRGTLLSAPLLEAIRARVQRGEQSLVLLNRRGFAPVLHCTQCDWRSDCAHCSAWQVFHKSDRSLRCHHCGASRRVPPVCPNCGNPDIHTQGCGTEQLQEALEDALRNVQRPDRQAARVGRIDADSTRAKGALAQQLAHMHAGDIDVLVGTQMIAKGHDFRRITLVAAVQPDNALFSSDYRAPERLCCLLMQAAGRAGRDAQYMLEADRRAELWLQTREPQHSVWQALRTHDWAAFADAQLQERLEASLPPFSAQALLRADAKTQEQAQTFLRAAGQAMQATAGQLQVGICPPVPLAVARVAGVERAQMLLEAAQRPALQRFLHAWQPRLQHLKTRPEHRGVLRWLVDVDPLAI